LTHRITGNEYGDWVFTWKLGKVWGAYPNELWHQPFEIVFEPKTPISECGCGKIGFVQTLQALRLSDQTIVTSNSRWKLERATASGTFLDRQDGYSLPWYGSENDGTMRLGNELGKRIQSSVINAGMFDAPGPYYSEVVWKFETCAVCINGSEENFIYGGLQGIEFTLRGGRQDSNFVTGYHVDSTTTITKTLPHHSDQPSLEFVNAIDEWNAQQGNTEFNPIFRNPCDDLQTIRTEKPSTTTNPNLSEKVSIEEFDQMPSAELVNFACDAKVSSIKRRSAIESLAKSDNWRGLGKVLVEVTRNHNERLRDFYIADPQAFIQNTDGVQSLPIPELMIVQELVRINDPGALTFLRQYQEDRFSLPVTSMTGEALASIEHSAKILSGAIIERPSNDEDKKR